MSSAKMEEKKITTHTLQEMKKRGEKISMLTAYDYSLAKILDDAGIDVLLVGDSGFLPRSRQWDLAWRVNARDQS